MTTFISFASLLHIRTYFNFRCVIYFNLISILMVEHVSAVE
jgi:hypothetical protein